MHSNIAQILRWWIDSTIASATFDKTPFITSYNLTNVTNYSLQQESAPFTLAPLISYHTQSSDIAPLSSQWTTHRPFLQGVSSNDKNLSRPHQPYDPKKLYTDHLFRGFGAYTITTIQGKQNKKKLLLLHTLQSKKERQLG
jgi:hypothetical protein